MIDMQLLETILNEHFGTSTSGLGGIRWPLVESALGMAVPEDAKVLLDTVRRRTDGPPLLVSDIGEDDCLIDAYKIEMREHGFWRAEMIPIADSGGGDYVCVHAVDGSVHVFDHEVAAFQYRSRDVNEWIAVHLRDWL